MCDSMRFWRIETAGLDFYNLKETERAYDRMREHYRHDVELKNGVGKFLQKAKAAGIKMCIASATRRDVSEPFLQKTRLLDFMEFYIDCHEVGVFKERPDIYLIAAERLDAEIAECAVFEDAAYCTETSKRAGFFTAGVFDEVAEEEGDTRKFCDVFIDDWRGAELI